MQPLVEKGRWPFSTALSAPCPAWDRGRFFHSCRQVAGGGSWEAARRAKLLPTAAKKVPSWSVSSAVRPWESWMETRVARSKRDVPPPLMRFSMLLPPSPSTLWRIRGVCEGFLSPGLSHTAGLRTPCPAGRGRPGGYRPRQSRGRHKTAWPPRSPGGQNDRLAGTRRRAAARGNGP